MKQLALIAVLAVAITGTACAPHIAPYKPKKRHLDAGEFGTRNTAQNGSLYAEGQAGLFEDPVAGRVGDILVVVVDGGGVVDRALQVDREDRGAERGEVGGGRGAEAGGPARHDRGGVVELHGSPGVVGVSGRGCG